MMNTKISSFKPAGLVGRSTGAISRAQHHRRSCNNSTLWQHHAPSCLIQSQQLLASPRCGSLFKNERSQVCRAGKTSTESVPRTASETALAYYALYNERKIDEVIDLIADDCVYEDLIYNDAFRGKEAIRAYFKKIESLIPGDVLFVVEDITEGDPRKVGVRWHVELYGVGEFPFSRGVSFYETNEQGQIIFARDIVEPTLKPGATALQGIAVIAPIVRRLGPAANPANISKLPLAAGAMGAFWIAYLLYVLLSTAPPGDPVWRTSGETIQALINQSYNFFYVNIALAQAGLNPVPCIAENPVDEGIFNFVNAWSMMMWPAWVADPLGKKVDQKLPLWIGTMALTNVFLPLYMALRLVPPSEEETLGKEGGVKEVKGEGEQGLLPWYAPAFGGVAAAVGFTSLYWIAAARPEYGGLAERVEYFMTQASTDRVFWAFCLDSCLYSVWQAWIMDAAGAPAWQKYTPFFGMAAWLLTGKKEGQETTV